MLPHEYARYQESKLKVKAYRFDDVNVFRRFNDGITVQPDDPDFNRRVSRLFDFAV